MKKLSILLLTFSLTLTSHTKAQEAFDKGKTVITVGYGVPNLARVGLRILYGSYAGYTVKGFGPILVKGDYGVLKNLGVGAVIGYSDTKLSFDQTDTYYYNSGYYGQTYSYRESLTWTSLSLGAHANYHFVRNEKVDGYVGGGLGYTINNITYSNTDPYNRNRTTYTQYNPNAIYYAITVGMRYYFTPNIGFYIEGGIEKGALIQGGLAVKF